MAHEKQRSADASIVSRSEAVAELARELRAAGSFALDTEFIRERTYRPRLCLIQVATREGSRIIDPLGVDLAPFLELIYDPAVEKIVHSGEQDMEIFYALRKQVPRNVYDTQVAAAMAGHGESVSYGRLVEVLCGVRLRKAETYTDWLKRPLSREQVEYALNDVRFLIPMAASLRRELEEEGRSEWVADELLFYEDAATYERSGAEAFRRVRGASRLGARDLGVLRELAAWREEEAEAMDWPRGRILTDDLLVELARRRPRTLDAISAMRGVHSQLVRRCGGEILRRVARALSLPDSELPAQVERPSDSPELEAVADLLDVVLRARAAELRIAPAYLASRKDLAALVRRQLGSASGHAGLEGSDEDSLPILTGWRRRLVGEALLRVLRGESHVAVGVGGGRIEILPRPAQGQA